MVWIEWLIVKVHDRRFNSADEASPDFSKHFPEMYWGIWMFESSSINIFLEGKNKPGWKFEERRNLGFHFLIWTPRSTWWRSCDLFFTLQLFVTGLFHSCTDPKKSECILMKSWRNCLNESTGPTALMWAPVQLAIPGLVVSSYMCWDLHHLQQFCENIVMHTTSQCLHGSLKTLML